MSTERTGERREGDLAVDDGVVVRSRRRSTAVAAVVTAVLVAAGCAADRPVASPPPVVEPLILAIVGDHGVTGGGADAVGDLVTGWAPDLVLGVGDAFYASALDDRDVVGTDRYDRVVGARFCAFLDGAAPGPNCPLGDRSAGTRFLGAAGNHDHDDGPLAAYLAYFTFPGDELVFDVGLGPLHVWVLDSTAMVRSDAEASRQAAWLEAGLRGSDAAFDVVLVHHPPHSSSTVHGSTAATRLPFGAWGADLVLAGHDHTYERVELDGVTYVVNGLGGTPRYAIGVPVPGSVVRFADDWGALRLVVDADRLTGEFVTIDGRIVDRFEIARDGLR